MNRREFITLLGGAAAGWPLTARAQQPKYVRIGALVLTNADAQALGSALREGLRELGYVEGQNFAFEFRSAEGKADRLPQLAAELTRVPVDVIVATFTPCALAAKQALQPFRSSWRLLLIPSARASCKAWRGPAATSPASPTWLPRRQERASNCCAICGHHCVA